MQTRDLGPEARNLKPQRP